MYNERILALLSSIALILNPKYFFHEEIFNACYHKVQWKFPGWWIFEQYNNIICLHINNFTQRLVVDCTLMRVTSDLSHQDLQYIMMQTPLKSTYSKEKLSDVIICKDNTLIWLNYMWWEMERKWIGIVVSKKWWISYTGNVSVKWTRKDPQISNNIPFQSNLKLCNIQSL